MSELDAVKELIVKPARLEEIREEAFASTVTDSFASANAAPQPITYLPDKISYSEFFLNFLVPNKPCLFGPWLTEDWRCRIDWVKRGGGAFVDGGGNGCESSDGSELREINYDLLRDHFGCATVPVANCRSRRYDAQLKTDWKFGDYLDYLRAFGGHDQKEQEILYCKDWHFCRDFPDYNPYLTPAFFSSDWLNQYWDSLENDDYRFVYVGPSTSWTPFHADVLRSFSWSCNIFGTKTWFLFPKGAEEKLRDARGNLPFDVRDHELTEESSCNVFQRCGETIFVPSGWYHQVHNGDDASFDIRHQLQRRSSPPTSSPTISVNHNWLNGCNVDLGWKHLQSCFGDVKNAISDCADMDGFAEQCQLILKANEGMDYADFLDFLRRIAEPILRKMMNLSPMEADGARQSTADSFQPGSPLHDLFDLSRILYCARLMEADVDCLFLRDKDDDDETASDTRQSSSEGVLVDDARNLSTLITALDGVIEKYTLTF